MTREAQFEALASMWAEAHEDARMLCHWLQGEGQPNPEVLAAAQRALLMDEDPCGLRTQTAPDQLALTR
jgi:hypothetical protein